MTITSSRNFILILIIGIIIGCIISLIILPLITHSGKEVIRTSGAPDPIGPYSQAVRDGDTLFISGQIGINPATGTLGQNIEEQVVTIMENIKAILKEAGMDYSNVVQSRIYLINMSDFNTANEIYGTYFSGGYPERATIQVAGLPKDALIEIEMIARRS